MGNYQIGTRFREFAMADDVAPVVINDNDSVPA